MRSHQTSFCLVLLASVFSLAGSAAEEASVAEGLKPFVDKHALAGAVVLAANKEKVLAFEAVGFADVSAKTAMQKDSLFWVASMSKPITGAALMILVDEGKVKLDDPVEKFLPEFKNIMVVAEKKDDHVVLKKPAHPITVREIMSHTSGLPFKSAIEEPTLDVLPLWANVRSYTQLNLQSEPGTKYAYSNAGINTGGRIIEVVSGMPYETFLDKRLFEPLGMKDTTFWPNDAQTQRIAKSYKPNAAKDNLEEIKITQLKHPLSDRTRGPMPGGGLFSTAADLERFCRMVLNGGELDGKRYLSDNAVKEMTKRQTAETLKDSYGVGWSCGDGWAGHGGAYATNMTVDFKKNLVTIYLIQHAGFPLDGGKAHGVFKSAAEKLFGVK